jgi:hypothetical protein
MRRKRLALSMLLLVVAVACSGSDAVQPDPTVAQFVGTWDGTVFTVTSDGDPATVVDVLSLGAFHIIVEPSGQYTATLAILGVAPEIGQLTVVGSTIVLDPTTPATAPSATSTYAFTADDYLVLDGPTEFDFNFDGTDEPAQAHIELQRR